MFAMCEFPGGHQTVKLLTSNNQRLGSAFGDLNSRLSLLVKLVMMSSAPAKSAVGA